MSELLDPDTCERMFYKALEDGDARGVEAALIVMAPQDPYRAQRLYAHLQLGLAIVRTAAPPITGEGKE